MKYILLILLPVLLLAVWDGDSCGDIPYLQAGEVLSDEAIIGDGVKIVKIDVVNSYLAFITADADTFWLPTDTTSF